MLFKSDKNALLTKIQQYYPEADLKQVADAFDFAANAHDGQTRSNGEPYFTHCIAVTDILADKKMGTSVLITALLHDTVEDTPVTIQDISTRYGDDVASLVAGVTKLQRVSYQHAEEKQAENFRKLLLAMSEDIRVLLIKLADRLHNIRTLHFIRKADKRLRIATETMDIYVPLADRIGIHDWKEELEDICFMQMNTDVRESIVRRLEYLLVARQEYMMDSVIEELSNLLEKNNVIHSISGRKKTPYSIWKKMQTKDVGFEQLSDIMAFRIITQNLEDCYRVLGIIHAQYNLVPGRFKDYISLPKPNGYQSLHTGIIGLQRQRIEIQIRTEDMHTQSQLGMTAHWNYKRPENINADPHNKHYQWMQGLLEILETSTGDHSQFWQDTRMEMYGDQVFLFTPKGDIVTLPKGACAIDFAYSIHSKIGDHISGAKVNGRMMPIKEPLQNGDQVEILTNKNISVNESWESFVVSGRSRSAIRRYLRIRNREEKIAKGQEMLENIFEEYGFVLHGADIRKVADYFGYQGVDTYLMNVAEGTRGIRESLNIVHPQMKEKNTPKNPIRKLPSKSTHSSKERCNMLTGLTKDMPVRFPRCCYALPGDCIVGVVHTGQGVSIHKVNCHELKNQKDLQDNWIDVGWNLDMDNAVSFSARLYIIFTNEKRALSDVMGTIANFGADVTDFQVRHRSEDVWGVDVDIEIDTKESLTSLMAHIRMIHVVTSVSR